MNAQPDPLSHPWIPLLLADPSPCLRLRVLRDLLGRPEEDDEVRQLLDLRSTDPLAAGLCALQHPDGAWRGGIMRAAAGELALLPTAVALMRLAFLGFGSEHPPVQRGAEYLFGLQRPDGAWPLPDEAVDNEPHEGYSMIPLQTALPLRGLAACGYAADPRAERAYAWLLEQRLPDGAWPTGIAAGAYGYVAGYRRIAHSRWGCRNNTTGALLCLALDPLHRSSPPAQRALDLLLGRETREKQALGFEAARLAGLETARGFITFYARFDLALLLALCSQVGAAPDDPRLAELVDFIWQQQGPYGLWDYAARPQAARWVTFDILLSLSRLSAAGPQDWLSQEPRTPFQPYRRQVKRY